MGTFKTVGRFLVERPACSRTNGGTRSIFFGSLEVDGHPNRGTSAPNSESFRLLEIDLLSVEHNLRLALVTESLF